MTLAGQLGDPRPRKRGARAVSVFGVLGAVALTVVAVLSRRDLLRSQVLAHEPAVDPDMVDISVGVAAAMISVGFAVVMAFVLGIAARVDRALSRDGGDGEVKVAWFSTLLTTSAAMAASVVGEARSLRIGDSLPAVALIGIAVLALFAGSGCGWARSARTVAVHGAVALVFAFLVCVGFGWSPT